MPASPTSNPQDERRYWAFISYSHQDERWGKWLHHRLETFRLPKRLVGTSSPYPSIPAKLFPVFRDRDELPVSADLGRNISEALRLSRHLVVICSPAAARSRWVNEEILTFKRLGRSDRILAMIVAGEPNAADGKPGWAREDECFPEALRFAIGPDGQLTQQRIEPIAADVRPGQDGRENAFLKLVAGILGVPFDALRQREQERRLQRLRLVTAGVSLLLLLFAALGAAFYVQRNRAEAALAEVRQTLSRSDYLQAVDALRMDASPEALAFLARAVRTNPRHAAATDLLISALSDRRWLLPLGEPVPLGEEVGLAVFDRQARALFVSEGMDVWRVLDPDSREVRGRGRVTPPRIGRAAFAPDGQGIAIASGILDTNTLGVWDILGGTLTSPPMKLGGAPGSIVFSQNGQTLLVPEDTRVEQRDVRTGATSRPSLEHNKPVMAAAYTPDGFRIIYSALFNTYFWDAASGAADGPPLKHDAIPQSLAVTLDGDRLAIALGDGTAQVFNLPGGEPMGPPLAHRSDINEVLFSDDGQLLLTTSNDRTAVIWDLVTGRRWAEAMRHAGPVIAGVFAPGADTVLTVSGGQGKAAQLHRWRLNRHVSSTVDLPQDARVVGLSIRADGRQVLACTLDGTVRLWDARTGALTRELLPPGEEIADCLLSPDGQTVATVAGPVVTLWGLATGGAPLTLTHDGPVNALDFSPDGRRVVTASADGTVAVWRTQDGAPQGPVLRQDGAVLGVAFNPDGGLLLTRTDDGVARLWDARTGQPQGEPMGLGDPLTVANFSADGRRVLLGSRNGVARVWDAGTGQAITPQLLHEHGVTAARFSPDGQWVITATGAFGERGAARVWDATSGRPLTDPMPHPDGVASLALEPKGRRLVTGAFDGKLRFWDPTTGKPLSVPIDFDAPIVRLEYPRNGSPLAIASGDRVVLMARVDTLLAAPDWLAGLAERVGGLRFTASGLLESVPERAVEGLARDLGAQVPRDDYERFGHCFLSGATCSLFPTDEQPSRLQ